MPTATIQESWSTANKSKTSLPASYTISHHTVSVVNLTHCAGNLPHVYLGFFLLVASRGIRPHQQSRGSTFPDMQCSPHRWQSAPGPSDLLQCGSDSHSLCWPWVYYTKERRPRGIGGTRSLRASYLLPSHHHDWANSTSSPAWRLNNNATLLCLHQTWMELYFYYNAYTMLKMGRDYFVWSCWCNSFGHLRSIITCK